MRKIASILALVSTGVAAPAMAQEERIDTYAGLIGGYDHVRLEAFGTNESKDGFVYGAVLGAQSDIGTNNFVMGLEAEITGATTKERVGTESIKAGRDLSFSLRMGVRPSEGVLVYAKAGYTNARITYEDTDPASRIKVSDNLQGIRLGGGVDVGSGPLRWRAEYRYSNYGDFEVGGVSTGISAKRHQVVIGALYAF